MSEQSRIEENALKKSMAGALVLAVWGLVIAAMALITLYSNISGMNPHLPFHFQI